MAKYKCSAETGAAVSNVGEGYNTAKNTGTKYIPAYNRKQRSDFVPGSDRKGSNYVTVKRGTARNSVAR